MPDFEAAADKVVAAYNAQDFDGLAALIAPDLDFAHFNRDFALDSRDALIDILKQFAAGLIPDRKFETPERVTSSGNVVVREGWWTGTCQVDVPGFGSAGDAIKLKFCTVLRFDDDGILVEWKDHG